MGADDAARELVDVIDDDGTVVTTATRAEVRAGNLLHRSVFIAVVTSDGRLIVHQRADWKDVWPSRWDVCFGGVVDAGETAAEAAVRELREEAGLTRTIAELHDLGEGRYEDALVREIGHVYCLVTDDDVTFADGEVVAGDVVPLADLAAWCAGRQLCPDSEALVLPRLTPLPFPTVRDPDTEAPPS